MSSFLGNQGGEPKEDFIDELLEFGDEYQTNDFPNPDREDCPDGDALSKAARSGRVLDENLREHILTCSPCFTEFKNLRNASTPRLYPKVMVAGIGAFTVVIFVAIAFFLFADWSSKDGTQVSGNKTTGKAESSEPTSAPPLQKDPTKELTEKSDTAKDIRTFSFDIASNNVDRGGMKNSERKSLPAENVKIYVRLADGSPSGLYTISLLDEFGRSLSSETGAKSDGVTLTTRLDLTRLGGPARLCIAAGDEIPDCFSILIK